MNRLLGTASLVLLSCGVSTAAVSASLGVNSFDLARQYLGRASAGDGSDRYRRVEVAMADKAMQDAEVSGAAFARISATGFGPSAWGGRSDLDLWTSNPAEYWSRMDALMASLDRHKLRAVFGFVWNALQFPAMTHENVRDMVTNPNSKSYQLAAHYIDEFVRRYRGRPTVLFYELTNEFNLRADLDNVGRCKKGPNPQTCTVQGNYTTDEMIAFCQRLAAEIRNADHNARTSSGFSLPRQGAEHMRAHPEWITGKTDFTPDSYDQFLKNLREIHAMVDIIGVHIYPDAQNARFGATDPRSTASLEASVRAAHTIGKPLFVGEFGDSERGDSDESSFTVRVMQKLAELKPDYAAPWVWEFYQSSLYQTHNTPDSVFSMEPGLADRQIEHFRQLARQFGQNVPSAASLRKDPPNIVLTWPLDCSTLGAQQLFHAVASEDAGHLRTVEFLVDGKQFAEKGAYPYEVTVPTSGWGPGAHDIKARALAESGQQADFDTQVVVGSAAGGACPKVFPAGH